MLATTCIVTLCATELLDNITITLLGFRGVLFVFPYGS